MMLQGSTLSAPTARVTRARSQTGMTEFLIVAGCIVLAVALTMLFGGSFLLYIANIVLLASIGALGLNLLMGTAGQVSIGNAAFLTTGAFATVWCERNAIPFPLDIGVAMIACGFFGILVGLPALRIKGIYLILSTMAAHFVALFVAEKYQSAEVGSAGFTVNPIIKGGLLAQQRGWAPILLVVTLVVMLVCTWLQNGRSGRAWRVVRTQEDAAPAMGIPVARYKLIAFVLSSAIIGLQGSLSAHFSGNVSSESFPLSVAIAALAMILIGGLGSIAGSIIGAMIVTTLPYVTPPLVEAVIGSAQANQHAARISLILYGLLIILFIGYAREGVRGWIITLWHAFQALRKVRSKPGST